MNSSHTEWQHGGGDGYDNRGANRSHGHGYGRSYGHGHGHTHTHRPGSPYMNSHSHSTHGVGMPQSNSNLKNSENLNASTRHMNKPAPQSYPSYDHRNAHHYVNPPNVNANANVHSYHPYYGHSHAHFPPPADHHQRYMHAASINAQTSHSHSSMHKTPYPPHSHSNSLHHDVHVPPKRDSASVPVPESHITGVDKVHGNNAPNTRDNESVQTNTGHMSKTKSQEPSSLGVDVDNNVLNASIPTSTTGTNNSSSEMPPSSEELPRRVLMFSPAAVSNKERDTQSVSHPSSSKHLTLDTSKTSLSSPPSPSNLIKNTHTIKPNNHAYLNEADPRNESYGTNNQYFSHHAPRTRDQSNPNHFDDRHNSYYDPNYQYHTNNFPSSSNQTSKSDDHYPSHGGMQSSRQAFEHHYKQQNQHSHGGANNNSTGGGAPLTPYWNSAASRKDFDTFHSNSPHFDFDKFTPTPLSTKGNNMKRRDAGNPGFGDSHYDQGRKRSSSFDEFHRPDDNYHISPAIAPTKLGESHRTTFDQDGGYPNDTISHQRHLSPHNIGRSSSSAVRYCTPIVTGGSRSNHSKTYFGPESSSHGFTPSTSGPGPYSSFDDHFDSALGHYHRPYTSSRSGPVSPTRYDNRSPHFRSNPPPDYSTPVIPRGDIAIQRKSEASYYDRAYGYENEHYNRYPRPHHPYHLPSGSGFFSPHVPYRRVDGGMLPSPTDVATTNPSKKRRVTPGGSEKPKTKSGASKNQRRQKMYSDYVGVTYNKTHAKFQACITHYRKQYYLGRFKLAVDAARAYDIKARDMKGPGWKINFQSDEDYERAKKKEIDKNEMKKKKDLESESKDNGEGDDEPITEDNAQADAEEENITDEKTGGAKSKLQVTPSPGNQNTIKSTLQTKVNEPSLSPYTDRFDASFSPMFSSMLTPSAPPNKEANQNDQTPGTSFLNSVLKSGEDTPNMAANIFASPLVTEKHSRAQIENRDTMSMDNPSEDKVTKDGDVEESNEEKEPKDLDAVSALLMVGGRHQ